MSDATPGTLLRLAAFTTDPAGGNPAGVWIGAALPPPAEMLRIAADVGYSETAFLAPDDPATPGTYRVRYFSPARRGPVLRPRHDREPGLPSPTAVRHAT